MFFVTNVETITPQSAVDEFFTGQRMIVDVRGDAEWHRVRVPGATHVRLGPVRPRLGDFPTDRPIAYLCRSGHRSALAARLVARQRADVMSIAGGLNAWIAAGLPTADCAQPVEQRQTG